MAKVGAWKSLSLVEKARKMRMEWVDMVAGTAHGLTASRFAGSAAASG